MGTAKCNVCMQCVHFSKDMQACTVRPDGLYIPPRVHMQTYCLTQGYKLCPTYTRYCLVETHNLSSVNDNQVGRRKFFRIPKTYKVLVQTCDSIGTIIGDFAEQALTLDYSQGGMRIVIDREIPSDSLLRFDFGTDFVAPQLQGIAKICWHKKRENQPHGIEAGLAFKDHFSQAVLAVQANN